MCVSVSVCVCVSEYGVCIVLQFAGYKYAHALVKWTKRLNDCVLCVCVCRVITIHIIHTHTHTHTHSLSLKLTHVHFISLSETVKLEAHNLLLQAHETNIVAHSNYHTSTSLAI